MSAIKAESEICLCTKVDLVLLKAEMSLNLSFSIFACES